MTITSKEYIFKLEMDVRDYEVDYEGIVNNSVYLNYMEHTRHEFCKQAGLTFEAMHLNGIDPVVRRAEIDYLAALKSGDHFVSCLNIGRRGPLFIFHQDIFSLPEHRHVARGCISIASIVNGKLSRGNELAAVFARYLNSSSND